MIKNLHENKIRTTWGNFSNLLALNNFKQSSYSRIILVISREIYKVSVKKIKLNMKKFRVLLIIAFCMSVFVSCKTREKCPAYGKVQPAKSHTLPS